MRDPLPAGPRGARESTGPTPPPGPLDVTPRGLVEPVPVAALHPWDLNPRRIDRSGWETLLESLRREPDLMWARPLIARTDGAVIGGNMRLRAVEALGWIDVPTVVVEADEERSIQIALRDNSTLGEWDEDALAELLASLGDTNDQEMIADISAQTAMPQAEIIRLFAAPDGDPPPAPDWTEVQCEACGHVMRRI